MSVIFEPGDERREKWENRLQVTRQQRIKPSSKVQVMKPCDASKAHKDLLNGNRTLKCRSCVLQIIYSSKNARIHLKVEPQEVLLVKYLIRVVKQRESHTMINHKEIGNEGEEYNFNKEQTTSKNK
jgi:hypothetical protein